jgi:hypothetical protein
VLQCPHDCFDRKAHHTNTYVLHVPIPVIHPPEDSLCTLRELTDASQVNCTSAHSSERPDFSTVTSRDRDREREMERANSDTESSDESEALGPTRVVDVPVSRR